jgi:hypothetical protein
MRRIKMEVETLTMGPQRMIATVNFSIINLEDVFRDLIPGKELTHREFCDKMEKLSFEQAMPAIRNHYDIGNLNIEHMLIQYGTADSSKIIILGKPTQIFGRSDHSIVQFMDVLTDNYISASSHNPLYREPHTVFVDKKILNNKSMKDMYSYFIRKSEPTRYELNNLQLKK